VNITVTIQQDEIFEAIKRRLAEEGLEVVCQNPPAELPVEIRVEVTRKPIGPCPTQPK
jgi:hypothetical protein